MIIIFIIFIILNFGYSFKYLNYFIPFYNFSLHNTPVILTNETILENELKYYKEIKKISVIHVAGSGIVALTTFGLSSIVFSFMAPVTFCYWG